jgi:hypothetical protein
MHKEIDSDEKTLISSKNARKQIGKTFPHGEP